MNAPALRWSDVSTNAATSERCLHCNNATTRGDAFCCLGCERVFELLGDLQLTRYYELRGDSVGSAVTRATQLDTKWLESVISTVASATGPTSLQLDIQGIHCAACVWLIETVFSQQTGNLAISVNSARGVLHCTVSPSFDLASFVAALHKLGYQLGPALKKQHSSKDGLLLRAVICLALAGNAMMLASAHYLGLTSGPLFHLTSWLGYAFTAITVWLGAPLFLRSAWFALRRGILHLDLPISLGIVTAFAGSTWAFLTSQNSALYYDTVAIFVALMVLGRWLQSRVIENNRNKLLASDGTNGLFTRKLHDGLVKIVSSHEIAEHDQLLLVPGDVALVGSILEQAAADFSLEWISGESQPCTFTRGQVIPAGAILCGNSAVRVTATQAFSVSTLTNLLTPKQTQETQETDGSPAHGSSFARRIAGPYVLATLVCASFAGAGWLWLGNDLAQALSVVISILVVTCPCAIGIAGPLATELTMVTLRRHGVFVRKPHFFDNALNVKKIIFDKTGTLTTGQLKVANAKYQAGAGSPKDWNMLYNMVARSNHPVSLAIYRWMENQDVVVSLNDDWQFKEIPGYGVASCNLNPAAVLKKSAHGTTIFSVGQKVLCEFQLSEELRPNAHQELADLTKAGFELYIASGDQQGRVDALAKSLDVNFRGVHGGLNPAQKADLVAQIDNGDTLFLGDGINDALAAQQATTCGTPSIDRPYVANLCDFYLITPSLAVLHKTLMTARRLQRVVSQNFIVSSLYNVVAVTLCVSGIMQPWLAAIFMPVSSLSIVFLTAYRLAAGRAASWKS